MPVAGTHIGGEGSDVLRTQWTTMPDGRIAATAEEARYRVRRALDAIAGRREPNPWLMVVALTAAGVLAGWLAAAATRRTAAAVVGGVPRPEEPFGPTPPGT
jgi:hypothetical protein